MTESEDIQLLQEFAERQSEAAFGELARRHVNLVYSVALRQTRDPHHAEEITQAVFIILARKASSIGRKTILSGWLYQTARLTAANFLRTERRRAFREQEAYMQSLSNESGPEVWRQIAPLLEDAMARLGAKDRDAVVLRFFEGKSLQEVGVAMGASEDAAKMRVNRALEKLRKIFAKRGVTLTGMAIAGAMAANSLQAAPAGLAATVTATAAKGVAAGSSILALANGVLKAMTWARVKMVVAVSFGVLISAAVLYLAVPKAKTQKSTSAISRTNQQTVATSVEQPPRLPATNYVLTEIGPAPGFVSAHVTSVNNHGQVVGWLDGANGGVHAFFWAQGNAIDLGTFGGSKAIASGINDRSEIVAVVLTNEQRRVFVLQESRVTDLGAIDSFAKLGTEGNISYTPSVDINNRSQVTGRLMVEGDNQRSFLFGQGQISYFGLRGDGSICYAKAMNNRGEIAGQSIQRDGRWGVFLWENGEITDLKTLGGPRASANAINDHGTVVGWANPAGAAWDQAHAIVWEKGKLLDLNAAGWKTSRAASINNAGEIVGYATTTNNRSFAFLKRGKEILDLNDLVATNSGWHLIDASAITERGQILARGKKGRELRTFLVSPAGMAPVSPAKPAIASAVTVNSTAAAAQFNLSSFERLPSGAFRLAFAGQPGIGYAIEASTNLTIWVLLGEATNHNGQVEFVDHEAPKFAMRFYRIVGR